jgi:hypothetical protein
MKIFSRRNLTRFLILALVFTSTLGTRPTSAIQQSDTEKANAAVTNAEDALNFAQNKRIEATTRLASLREFSAFEQPNQDSLNAIRRLTEAANGMFNETTKTRLQTELIDAQAKLLAALQALNTSKLALASAASTAEIESSKSAVQTKMAAISSQLDSTATSAPELVRLSTQLDQTLNAVYPHVEKVAKAADDRLKPFTQNITDANDLVNLFKNQFSEVPSLIQFQLDLQPAWSNLSEALSGVVNEHVTRAAPVNEALASLKTTVENTVKKLNTHIAALNKNAQQKQAALVSSMEGFRGIPSTNERVAIASIQAAQRQAEALDKINRTAASIGTMAESAGIAGFSKDDLDAAHDDLTAGLNDLRLQATRFQELLSGDRSLWITEKIRLYYFTDIPRLVQTLNPTARLTGGDTDARRQAEVRLERLRAAEDAQSEADGKVANLKRQVDIIKQQLREAEADLNLANIRAQRAARQDTLLSRRPESELKPGEKEDSTAEKNRTERERQQAQGRFDKLSNAQTGLAADLAAAEAQLVDAQEAFDRASRATIRAAQAESAAFANARDNAAFWFAEADSNSTDPAKRVDITSSTNGENAIFIRGWREDVVKVQDIVARLDEPAPQARMTLWKIELNSDATQKGAERFNEALAIVEKELATTRANIADTLSILLQAVSEEAEQAAIQKKKDEDQGGVKFVRKDCEEIALYDEFQFEADPTRTDITGRYQRLRRYSLYSEQVRNELGIGFVDELGFDNPKQFGLKDPASATTLNEALIVMLLTDRFHRQQIMDRFKAGLKQKFGKNSEFGRDREFRKDVNFGQNGEFEKEIAFRRLNSAFELALPTEAKTELGTTRQQQELIYAIRGSLLKHLLGRIARLQDRVKEFQKLAERKTGYVAVGTNGGNGTNGTNGTNGGNGTNGHPLPLSPRENALYQCLQKKLPRIFDTIHDEFPISPFDIMKGRVSLVDTGEGTIGLQPLKDDLPVGPPKVYNLRPSPARVAAADGMLDVFTKAFEDDIDRHFVQPMLADLRKKLIKTGIGFGVIQRTSVLATNRLVARVDPRATAELSVGQETNLIQGLQQIAQLTLDARAGNIAGVFGQLGQIGSKRDEGAEIYGITSGSAFQVTPIFDPTGQALRFKFDFVDTTLVRDPRGTTNPRIPRIERHTVNTEVQLANMELREISRFESDAKIGIPTTYWGGVPLLKDLPGVRPIPLIGWFVRRKGSNAIAQRSLIFAQTTMSPTIGDILDLFDTSLQRR